MPVAKSRGLREAPKAVRSSMETLLCDQPRVGGWIIPPFQRPLKVNEKVRLMVEHIKQNGGVISGVITIGQIDGDKNYYVVDGQHRIEAFKLSELPECIMDVRICRYANMGEMANDFVNLNTALVKMRPDDILRGLEGSVPVLRFIREQCPFITYGQLKRTNSIASNAAVVSMSSIVRCWWNSQGDTPKTSLSGSTGINALVHEVTELEAQRLVNYANIARTAWGNDSEYHKLWGQLNLILCMWMFRRLVIEDRSPTKKHDHLSVEKFKRCLMGLSASKDYLDWLVGRNLSDRDRGPCYTRIKTIFIRKLNEEGPTHKPRLPTPDWGSE